MNIIQPSILPGFMELLPQEQVLFDQVKETIERTYRRYGYWPLDTPAIEKNEILFAKGGGETTKQIFRIEKGENASEQSLRFDLTVPLARYVAQHQSELSFPFRRYHIAKVYRGERNQRGRYREFYQADIDVIGLDHLSIINDAEVPAAIYDIFSEIGIPGVRVHINHRGLMNGFYTSIGVEDVQSVLHAVDKLGKVGADVLKEMLEDEGLDAEQIERIFAFIGVTDARGAEERLQAIAEAMPEDAPGADLFRQGYSDLMTIKKAMHGFGMPEEAVVVDLAITRGLDYYTGVVYETFIDGYESLGSVASGGRYDNLASNFSKQHMPGVGISIGLTRLFFQLREANLIAPEQQGYIDAIVIAMSDEEVPQTVALTRHLRDAGIVAQAYTEAGKLKKKFSYADAVKAQYTLIIGESERQEQTVSVKNMATGVQETLPWDDAIDAIRRGKEENA
ncbi:MAG: histidine--tRNA ligase [Peptoniphilaceae bacterium]|nr:histidine--tRNA ligase [Peptoniphilaceae bacterium]